MSESQLNYICSVLVMKKNQLTRKHSSRMHSARLCGGGWGMVMGRGIRSQGVWCQALQEGITPRGGCMIRGLVWEGTTPLGTESHTPVKTLPSQNFVCRR